MARGELEHLELLAEVDSLLERLKRWGETAPDWRPAETCGALLKRLAQRAATLRVRIEAPLVVATLGGTGTGKSALVNALLGAEVVETGRRRPTTTRPTLICRTSLSPEMLGIDPESVVLVQRDLPVLSDLVLIDCPDPDTTEEGSEVRVQGSEFEGEPEDGAHRSPAPRSPSPDPRPPTPDPHDSSAAQDPLAPMISQAEGRLAGSNLDRLRRILPNCDVLLVTTTQQKYRSGRVADELAAAAPGQQLVFVQTHADVDEDIREDWRGVLDAQYTSGHVFLVDSLAALADAEAGAQPPGEFAALVDLLSRQLAGAAANRIRRANFLDLVAEVLSRCRRRIDDAMPAVEQLRAAIDQQRTRLAARLAQQMRSELLASRRQWENRLLGRTASRWGLSPFALVLRLFQGLGGLFSGALLYRARTPAQLALWGAVAGARTLQNRSQQRRADRVASRAVADCFDRAELRTAAVILDGYATEAGLKRDATAWETVAAEADLAATGFVGNVSGELDSLIARLAARHTGFFTRWRYELALAVMLGWMLFRLGKNFFYDSWLGSGELLGLDFYVQCMFWLVLWCLLLIWALTSRLRRGLRREIDSLAEGWNNSASAAGVFTSLEDACRGVEQFRRELDGIEQHVAQLRRRLALPEDDLGRRRSAPG